MLRLVNTGDVVCRACSGTSSWVARCLAWDLVLEPRIPMRPVVHRAELVDVLTRHHPVYILSSMATERAKLFRNGGSQAVRLPRDCRFPSDQAEVLVHREGRRIILEPVDEWPDSVRSFLGSWDEPIERPKQQPLSKARDPFRR